MLDNREVETLMEVLEQMEDEILAAELLKKFNEKSKALGTLILNLDPSLDHGDWKKKCDQAQKELDQVVEDILSHK